MIQALLLLALTAPATAAAPPPRAPVRWHALTSPHFRIMYESSWSPASISLEMERMYSSMRLNLAMFAPWMVRERSRIYIYSSAQDYLRGEFHPPPWSKGLAFVQKKTIVVYDTGDIMKLKAVIAHELTHLYFESYFAEKLKYPPQWLNEGLAVNMEESVYPNGGPWTKALPYFSPARRIPFDRFFGTRTDDLHSDAQIADWYLQAFGTVKYLYQPHKRLQFKAFCEAIRDGESVNDALWSYYRTREGADFSRKWTAWLQSFSDKETAAGTEASADDNFQFKPMQLSSFQFTNFGLKH